MKAARATRRDIESVERARRNSCDTFCESSLLNSVDLPLSDISTSRQSEDRCNRYFLWKLRFLHTIMAAVLAYVGLMQYEREDAAVWMALFLTPAMLTLISSINVKIIDRVVVRSLISVYLGSAMCLLLWLLTILLVVMIRQGESGSPIYNPLRYQQGREALAVTVCIGWQKFHLVTIKEQLKVSMNRNPHEASAQAVLRKIVPLLLVPAILAGFSYVESIATPIVSTASAIKKVINAGAMM